jgi:hypothetical protein
MSSLNKMITIAKDIEARLIASEGVLTEEIQKDLELNEYQLPVKIDSYVYTIDLLKDKITWISKRVESLKKLEGQIEDHIEYLEAKLISALDILQVEKLDGNQFKISKKLNPPKVDILDESLVPDAYKATKTTVITSIDKKKISEVLKNGINIPGVRLTQQSKLVIKENI